MAVIGWARAQPGLGVRKGCMYVVLLFCLLWRALKNSQYIKSTKERNDDIRNKHIIFFKNS